MLSISNLGVVIENETGVQHVLNDVSLSIKRGQTLAVVGESGSGKTLLALSIMRLLPRAAKIISGTISFLDMSLTDMSEKELRNIRGRRISMIFQEPGAALNPLVPVGEQIGETIQLHHGLDSLTCKEQVLALMEIVGIPDPTRRYYAYSHQLSGGIRQRVILAGALSCRPDLLVADEPTSALDTTVQTQIVDLLSRLIRDLGMSVLLITHDLGVVASMADRVAVLFDGYVVEDGSAKQVLLEPLHPYTKNLIASRALTGNSSQYGRISLTDLTDDSYSIQNCPFAKQCPLKLSRCKQETPSLIEIEDNHRVRCFVMENNRE